MKNTAIIGYISSIELNRMTFDCLEAYEPYYDEIILIHNGGNCKALTGWDRHRAMNSMVQFYSFPKPILHAGVVNLGAALANGEYLTFIDNGTLPEKLDPKKHMRRGHVLSPQIADQFHSYGAHASFFTIHKDDFNNVGPWFPKHRNGADEDWFKRARDYGLSMSKVDGDSVSHANPGATVRFADNLLKKNKCVNLHWEPA